MNHVYLSPHFPPNYHYFCAHLRRLGVNVLGVADEPRDWLRPEVQEALTRYYRVDDMHNQPMPSVFALAMGDYYLLRSPDLDEILAGAAFIQELE